ncbi:hypothetical protein ACHAWF_005272 [Thalassiosira exigua]
MSEGPGASKPAEPTEPKLCKMGCGFFGSNATGDCCSRCWASIKPKENATTMAGKGGNSGESEKAKTEAVKSTGKPQSDSTATGKSSRGKEGTAKPTSLADVDTPATSDPPTPARKKKKKTSYKSMMAGMVEGEKAPRDVEKEKEKLKAVTGGGHFQKIDKI